MVLGPVVDAARKISKKSVKVYSWYTLPASAGLWHLGPTRLGGKGDPRSKVYEEMKKSGRPFAEVSEEVKLSSEDYCKSVLLANATISGQITAGFSDSIRHVPGLPPMYDYEAHPQEVCS